MLKYSILAILCVFQLSGCANTKTQSSPGEVVRSGEQSSVSVTGATNPGFAPRVGSAFIWDKGGVWADPELLKSGNNQYVKIIQNHIEAELFRRGYKLAAKTAEANYVLGSAVIVHNSPDFERISNIFKVYPDVGRSLSTRPTAQLVMGVARPGGELSRSLMLWRSGAEVFVMQSDIKEEERLRRLHRIVSSVMASLP